MGGRLPHGAADDARLGDRADPLLQAERLALRAALLALALLAAPQARGACPHAPAAVRVLVEDAEPAFLNTDGVDALHALTGEPRAAAVRHLGLTTSHVEWTSEVAAAGAQGPDGVCVAPVSVTLVLRQVEHVVRVARELPPGSCLHAEVLVHERRHVAVNRETLREAARRAEAAATAWARTAEGRGATTEQAGDALRLDLRRAIEPALARMRQDQARLHAAIDSPAEYRRLSRVCPADHAALVAQLWSR